MRKHDRSGICNIDVQRVLKLLDCIYTLERTYDLVSYRKKDICQWLLVYTS